MRSSTAGNPVTDRPAGSPAGDAVVRLQGVSRRFRDRVALRDVNVEVRAGQVHALLGPNGAGKTTLLRVLTGVVDPDGGEVWTFGARRQGVVDRATRQLIGIIPAGARSFYLRLSGVENLVFFARLYGMRRRDAIERAHKCLAQVGLTDAADLRVGLYSQGMHKRLSVARALITEPRLLLIDEATHDLDPQGAEQVRSLVREICARGAAAVWATQRLEEVRGFADGVTVLDHGSVVFDGDVPALMALCGTSRHLVQLRNGSLPASRLLARARQVLDGCASVTANGDGSGHYLLSLSSGHTLGQAIAALVAGGIDVLACRDEKPEVESAFLRLVRQEQT